MNGTVVSSLIVGQLGGGGLIKKNIEINAWIPYKDHRIKNLKFLIAEVIIKVYNIKLSLTQEYALI